MATQEEARGEVELQPQTQNPSAGFHLGGDAVFLGFFPAGVHLCSPFVGCTLRTLYCPPLASPPSALCTRTGYPKYVGKKEEKRQKDLGALPGLGFSPLAKHQGGDITSSEHHHGGDRSGPDG